MKPLNFDDEPRDNCDDLYEADRMERNKYDRVRRINTDNMGISADDYTMDDIDVDNLVDENVLDNNN